MKEDGSNGFVGQSKGREKTDILTEIATRDRGRYCWELQGLTNCIINDRRSTGQLSKCLRCKGRTIDHSSFPVKGRGGFPKRRFLPEELEADHTHNGKVRSLLINVVCADSPFGDLQTLGSLLVTRDDPIELTGRQRLLYGLPYFERISFY